MASCLLGPAGCTTEDEPDDATKDASADTSVTPDASVDQRTDPRPDGACFGGGDAARDGALGMMVVQQLGCARCHQEEPADAGLFLTGRLTSLVAEGGIFPKNLTPDPVTGLGCWTDEQIIDAIMNGLDDKGQMLCTRMPRYGARIDGGNAQQIVDFLRTLPAVNRQIPESTSCPQPPSPEGGADAGDVRDAGGDSDGAVPEAGPDVVTDARVDTTPDAATPDAASPDGGDATTPDAGPDGATPEAGPDAVTHDAGPDTVAPDAGPDGAQDAAPDTHIDANDSDVDGSTADADNDANG